MVTYIHPPSDAPHIDRPSHPQSVREVLDGVCGRHSATEGGWSAPIATGFDLIDRVLEGGMHPGDLLLLGGSPGVGKTVAALQMARNMAMSGHPVVYLCYEHDSATMLGRLLTLELGTMARPDNAPEIDRLRSLVVAATSGYRSLDELLRTEPLIAEAHEFLSAYAERLWLVRGSSSHTDLDAMEESLPAGTAGGSEPVLIVDYLQKVAVHPEPTTEDEKVTRVVEGLKDLALRRRIAVIALVAADWDGVRSGRVRLHHLRGSSALAYECDVAVMLNDKHRAVSRTHLTFDAVKAESFHHQVVFSIEKNRSGPAMVDLEFRKDFLHYRFDPTGSYLMERLLDDRLAPD
jgi:replicative DNA helicase